MSLNKNLHKRLIARQSTEELKRKAMKAQEKSLYSQEGLDYAGRWADEMSDFFKTFDNGDDYGLPR
jgi:hypothetical protein